jgi:hypothetical protein
MDTIEATARTKTVICGRCSIIREISRQQPFPFDFPLKGPVPFPGLFSGEGDNGQVENDCSAYTQHCQWHFPTFLWNNIKDVLYMSVETSYHVFP